MTRKSLVKVFFTGQPSPKYFSKINTRECFHINLREKYEAAADEVFFCQIGEKRECLTLFAAKNKDDEEK